MNLCKVCGQELSAKNKYLCGFCHFDPPYVLDGNAEEALRKNIFEEKKNLLQKLQTAIKVFCYDVSDTAVKENGEEYLSFPAVRSFDTMYWLEEQFVTVNNREKFSVQLSVLCNDHLMYLSVPVNNIREAEYLCVGISVDTDFNVTVAVKDQKGGSETSPKTYMFSNRS